MGARFAAGDLVQTPFGKGMVSAVRNGGRLLVQIQQRALVVDARQASLLAGAATAAPARATSSPRAASGGNAALPLARARHGARARPVPGDVDLHGLTVVDALASIDAALDAALVAGLAELRFIHGRSGGKLRGALHQRLRAISAVRGLRLDPRNPGVTIVAL